MQKEGESRKIVMLPSNYAEQLEKLKKSPVDTKPVTTSINKASVASIKQESHKSTVEIVEEDGENKKKKRACNCTKSMCLKFYCDCFANGEYCQNCNCKDCLNLVDSQEREKAIKLCLEKNPLAFK